MTVMIYQDLLDGSQWHGSESLARFSAATTSRSGPPITLRKATPSSPKRETKSSSFDSDSKGYPARRQNRVVDTLDYAPPPPGYFLVNLEAGGNISIGKQTVELHFAVNNLTNTRYRDYMDRFRYFTDAMGRNYSLRIKIPFDCFDQRWFIGPRTKTGEIRIVKIL